MLLDLMHRFNKDIDSLIFMDFKLRNECLNGELLGNENLCEGSHLVGTKKIVFS